MNDDRSRNPMGDRASRPSESWLFAEEVLGRPVHLPPELIGETTADREHREFVEGITNGRVSPAPASRRPAAETPAEGEQREWVESIMTHETWDPALHPRGGFPQNAGWFSPSGGSGGVGASSHGHAPLRSWPEPMDQAQSQRADRVRQAGGSFRGQAPSGPRTEPMGQAQSRADSVGRADDYERSATTPNRARQTDQVALQPPPNGPPQPAAPPVGAQPAAPRAAAAPPNPYGTWPDRPPGTKFEQFRNNGMHFTKRFDIKNAFRQLPPQIKAMLENGKVIISLEENDSAVRAEYAKRNIPWKNATVALYDRRTGMIYIFDKFTRPDNTLQLTGPDIVSSFWHEVGHAIDHYLGDVSLLPGFSAAHRLDINASSQLAGLTAKDKHYLSRPKEGFAEAFARLKAGDVPGVLGNSVRYLKAMPEIRQLMTARP